MKKYYYFHCPICLEIQFIYLNSKNEMYMNCPNEHDYNIDKVNKIEDLKFLNLFSFKCKQCSKNIELYETIINAWSVIIFSVEGVTYSIKMNVLNLL